MQLGELQHQFERFKRRNVRVVALSVDAPTDSLDLITRLDLEFPIGSDPEQALIRSFGVQNPQTRELAIHAVYIVGRDARVIYRKVGGRRPLSAELIDAIDASRGNYPNDIDAAAPRTRSAVAFPSNDFQALLALTPFVALSPDIDIDGLQRVRAHLRNGRLDPAIIEYRRTLNASAKADAQALENSASWLVRALYLADNPEALAAGNDLERRLLRLRELEAAEAAAANADAKDAAQQRLAQARAGLTRVRANIRANAQAWRLSRAKVQLRSYREVALAAAPRSTRRTPRSE